MSDMLEVGVFRGNMLQLCRRAAIDREFRERCLASPDTAYLELTGHPLPELYAVRFIEPEQSVLVAAGERPYCRLPPYIPKTWLG